MDIESFVSLKTSPELESLSNEITNVLTLLSGGKKLFKNTNNKGNQLLKNPKIQLLKDKIENKVNLILNKLSELNINNLLVEFVETLGKINEDEFNHVQKAFYQKMQSDISFVKIYIDFYKLISQLYILQFNYSNKFIINILESKFLYDYNDVEYTEEYKFLMDYEDENNVIISENKRVNHLTIIKNMIYAGILNENLENMITDQLLKQKNYYADIYYWLQNKPLDTKIKSTIKNIVSNNTLPLREKVLLDNLIIEPKNTDSNNEIKGDLKDVSVTKDQYKKEQNISTDTLGIESENIIEEYLYMESIDEVKAFIDSRCKDAISKNKFCQYLFNKYFESSSESSSKILEFVKILVKKQILFKSNLSRGLLLLYSNWEDLVDDFNNPNKKMKELLICLKNLGITKNLESLLKAHKIEYVSE
jgi:hypothetical protein